MPNQYFIGNEWAVDGVELRKEYGKGSIITVQLKRSIHNDHIDEYSTRGIKFYEDDAMGTVVRSSSTEIAQIDDSGIDPETMVKVQELASIVHKWCRENCYKKADDDDD